MPLNRQIKIRQNFSACMYIWRYRTTPPNLSPLMVLKMSFWAKPPNLMTANISGYTVCMYVCMSVTLPVAVYVMGVVSYRGLRVHGSRYRYKFELPATTLIEGTNLRYTCQSTANPASYKPAFPTSSLKHRLCSHIRKVSEYGTTQRLTRTRQRWR